MRVRLALAGVAILALGGGPATGEQTPPSFEVPAAGTYELPPITRVGEHQLLDPAGTPGPILGLAENQAALVSFVYAHCPQACPAALAVLQRVDRALAARPTLASRVRMVTVSFDPERDTPEQMGRIARNLAPVSDWRFLTAASNAEIAPVLEDYGQDTQPLRFGDDDPERLRHVLKVFLVDSSRSVRNIYSSGFMTSELLLADLETVLGGG